MGTNPAIRVKGMSQVRYNFLWDKEIRHYAYEPESQKEVDDIFRTQGKLYKTLFFSVWLEPETKEEEPKAKSRKSKGKSQPVAEELAVS